MTQLLNRGAHFNLACRIPEISKHTDLWVKAVTSLCLGQKVPCESHNDIKSFPFQLNNVNACLGDTFPCKLECFPFFCVLYKRMSNIHGNSIFVQSVKIQDLYLLEWDIKLPILKKLLKRFWCNYFTDKFLELL